MLKTLAKTIADLKLCQNEAQTMSILVYFQSLQSVKSLHLILPEIFLNENSGSPRSGVCNFVNFKKGVADPCVQETLISGHIHSYI